jgi:hypothetical protein
LHDRLAEAEKDVQDSDDPAAAQKAAKAIEAIIRYEHCQESYDRIKRAIKGISGNNGLDRLDVPLRTPAGTDSNYTAPPDARKILLEVDNIHQALLEWNKKRIHPLAMAFPKTLLASLV